jgi:formyl-CoA transferase
MRSEPHFVMRPYQCSDGRWLQINMVRSRPLILRMLEVMGAAARLDEERFATPELTFENRVAFGDALQDTFAMRTSGEWLSDFAAADLPVNLVALVEEVLDDAQVHDNGIAAAAPDLGVPHLVHHPVKISSVPQVEPRRPPAYGEHSEEILRELGYTEADITAMREGGVTQVQTTSGSPVR